MTNSIGQLAMAMGLSTAPIFVQSHSINQILQPEFANRLKARHSQHLNHRTIIITRNRHNSMWHTQVLITPHLIKTKIKEETDIKKSAREKINRV